MVFSTCDPMCMEHGNVHHVVLVITPQSQTSHFCTQFMEQENAMSLLQFWLTAESFHTYMLSLDKHSDTEADTRDAITIYDRYWLHLITCIGYHLIVLVE